MKNPCLDAALCELEAAGVRGVERAVGGKHLQLRWRVNGGPVRLYTLPTTPSDRRAAANTRAGVRRLLREDGVLVEPAKPQPPPTTKIKIIEPSAQQRLADIELHLAAVERRLAALEAPKPK